MIENLNNNIISQSREEYIFAVIIDKINELVDIENARQQDYANILKESYPDKYYEIYPDEKHTSSLTTTTSLIDSENNLKLSIEQIGDFMDLKLSEKPKFPSNTILYEHYGNECPICDSSYKRKFILGIFPYILKPKHCINPGCINYFGNYVSNK